MVQDQMTPKERWLAAVRHQLPDRVPMYYRATSEATTKLMKHLAVHDHGALMERLHVDTTVGAGPRYVGPQRPAGEDMYGRRFRHVQYEGGSYPECIHHPLAEFETISQIDASYTWPSADWFDYSGIPTQVEGVEERVITGGGSEPFLIYKDLRGDEQAFMDLVEHPDIVHHVVGKLYDFCYENTRRIYEAIPGRVTVTSVAEDMGAQDRLLYSLPHLEEFFFTVYYFKGFNRYSDSG